MGGLDHHVVDSDMVGLVLRYNGGLFYGEAIRVVIDATLKMGIHSFLVGATLTKTGVAGALRLFLGVILAGGIF